MPLFKLDVDGGKYTVIQEDNGRLHALRHGEPWRDLVGDNLVLALAHEAERAQQVDSLKSLVAYQREQIAARDRQLGEAYRCIDFIKKNVICTLEGHPLDDCGTRDEDGMDTYVRYNARAEGSYMVDRWHQWLRDCMKRIEMWEVNSAKE